MANATDKSQSDAVLSFGATHQLLTVKQAARFLNVSPRTTWSLTRSGQLRSVRIGSRSVRYLIRDLVAFVDSRRDSSQTINVA